MDVAWLYFFAKLALSREALFDSHTALLYDVILFSTVTERPDGALPLVEEVVSLLRTHLSFYVRSSTAPFLWTDHRIQSYTECATARLCVSPSRAAVHLKPANILDDCVSAGFETIDSLIECRQSHSHKRSHFRRLFVFRALYSTADWKSSLTRSLEKAIKGATLLLAIGRHPRISLFSATTPSQSPSQEGRSSPRCVCCDINFLFVETKQRVRADVCVRRSRLRVVSVRVFFFSLHRRNPTTQVEKWCRNETSINGADGVWPGFLPNTAQVIPPDTRSGQWAFNGDLHVVDKVILPNPRAFCRPGDFEFNLGYAFSSLVVAAQTDDAGLQVSGGIVPRALPYNFCLRLPCTYDVLGLYGRAGFRLSVEAVVEYKSVLPLCDPWCSPTSWWWWGKQETNVALDLIDPVCTRFVNHTARKASLTSSSLSSIPSRKRKSSLRGCTKPTPILF